MYQSSRPTRERKQFHDFMERQKRQGQVGRKKVGRYIEKKGYDSYISGTGKKGGQWVDVTNKHGTVIAETLVKKKHVTWWMIK